jgi:hypothetical protein
MPNLFLVLSVCVLFLPFTTAFLTAPVSTVLNYPRRNLTCSQQTDEFYNGITTYEDRNRSESGFDYCAIAIVTFFVNNLTQTSTSRGGISFCNLYQNIAINRCGFSRTMDIGYGNCIPYDYETATSIQLCICPTNSCTASYSTCKTSVNQASSSPPPLLPVLQPTLSNIITCQDYYTNLPFANNITRYLGCEDLIALGVTDLSKCYTYTPNHTIICGVSYDTQEGSIDPVAMIEGDYELSMYNTIFLGAYGGDNGTNVYQYQTSTSIATIVADKSGQYSNGLCLCTTNNCNVDFSTCTSDMNIPSYLLSYNGSTSTISTISTSGGTTVSSSSTTRLINSASSSIITTLQSSTVTSIIASTTVSGISIGNTSTLAGISIGNTSTLAGISIGNTSTLPGISIGDTSTLSGIGTSSSLSRKEFLPKLLVDLFSLAVSLFLI